MTLCLSRGGHKARLSCAVMLKLHRHSLVAAVLAVIAFLLLYASAGETKPFAAWRWMDIIARKAAWRRWRGCGS